MTDDSSWVSPSAKGGLRNPTYIFRWLRLKKPRAIAVWLLGFFLFILIIDKLIFPLP
jgi:hypothetical protein